MAIWKSIPGHSGYEVSDEGNVRSVDRVVKGRRYRGKILSPCLSNRGKLVVTLGRRCTRPVHLLVMLAFVGPLPRGMETCHNNDDPFDNNLRNLRYDTRSGNIRDRSWNLKVRKNGLLKLHPTEVVLIRQTAKSSIELIVKNMSKRFGVTRECIRAILARRSWRF